MAILLGEGEDERGTSVHFLVIPYESIFNCIHERPFLAALDALASPIHLNKNIKVMAENQSPTPLI